MDTNRKFTPDPLSLISQRLFSPHERLTLRPWFGYNVACILENLTFVPEESIGMVRTSQDSNEPLQGVLSLKAIFVPKNTLNERIAGMGDSIVQVRKL